MTKQATIHDLIDQIHRAGGSAIFVGGIVRDWIMYGAPKGAMNPDVFGAQDVDIEVYGLTLPKLIDTLDYYGWPFEEVGEHFGVIKVRVPGIKNPVDLSIPRYENSIGTGHKEFEVMMHPELTFKEAARRRDFTINSMGFDPRTQELLDPYNGKIDIQLGVIRHVSDKFVEDPLRPLRAARFAARFNFQIDPYTLGECGSMSDVASALPVERVWMELEKVLLEGQEIHRFFYYLEIMGWLDILFPEVAALRGVEQDIEWHPEGDVLIHTMCSLDYWAENLRTGNKDDDLITAIAILCHDFGKVTHTQYDQKPGHITAHGHEEAGAEPTRTFLHRLRQYELAKEVVPLVENHLFPVLGNNTPRAIRRLSVKVKRLDLLAIVSYADQAGRPPKSYVQGHYKIEGFINMVNSMEVPRGGPKPLVGGDYLIELGITPGPHFKTILDTVYEAQLEGWINTPRMARNQAVTVARGMGFHVEYK